jgi:ABC-type transporter Mla MlaB component
MELFQVLLEAHHTGATIYMVGMLTHDAARRTESMVGTLASTTRVVRLDLRGVEIIDPTAFVVVARALNRWRDARSGRLAIEFPKRSSRAAAAKIHLVGLPSTVPPRADAATICR